MIQIGPAGALAAPQALTERPGDFKPGDLVRVTDPERFVQPMRDKVRDRDALVLRAYRLDGGTRFGGLDPEQTLRVRFLKRNSRGREFEETMKAKHFHKVADAQPEGKDQA